MQDGIDAPVREPEERAAAINRELTSRMTKLTAYVGVVVFVVAAFAVLIDQRVHEDLGGLNAASRDRLAAMLAARFEEGRLRVLRQAFFTELDQAKERSRQTVPPGTVPQAGEYDALEAAFADKDTLEKLSAETRQARFTAARTALTRLADRYRQPKQIFEDYEQHAEAYLTAVAKEEAASRTARETFDKKESIPSPFGEFNLHPSVALVLLAFITALSYILLSLETRRVLGLVSRTEGTSPSLAPVWLYTNDERCRAYFGWQDAEQRVRFMSAGVVHALWLALSVWMTAECFLVGATQRVQFTSPSAAKAALVLMNVIAIMLFVRDFFGRSIAPAVTRMRNAAASPITRRAVAAVIIVAVAGAAGFQEWRRRRHGASRRPKILQSASLTGPLVENAKTKVVHHRDVCGRHLPADGNRTPVQPEAWIHRGWEVPILYAAAIEIERTIGTHAKTATLARTPTHERETELEGIRAAEAKQFAPAIALLQRAVAQQPLSYHLHDKLIAIYGRLHQFDAIHGLLEMAVSQAKAAPKSRAADKALRELEQRRMIAKNAAANASGA